MIDLNYRSNCPLSIMLKRQIKPMLEGKTITRVLWDKSNIHGTEKQSRGWMKLLAGKSFLPMHLFY